MAAYPIQERGEGHLNAKDLLEKMNNAVPVSNSEIIRTIETIQTESDALQRHVAILERREEQSQRQVAALSQQVRELQLQVDSLEAEKTHISNRATAGEKLYQAREKHSQEQLLYYQEQLSAKERQHQAEMQAKDRQHQAECREHWEQVVAKEWELQAEKNLLKHATEDLNSQLRQARQHLASGTLVSMLHTLLPQPSACTHSNGEATASAHRINLHTHIHIHEHIIGPCLLS